MTFHFRRNQYILSCFNRSYGVISFLYNYTWTLIYHAQNRNGFIRKLTSRLDSLLKDRKLKPEVYPVDGLSTWETTPYLSAHAYSKV